MAVSEDDLPVELPASTNIVHRRRPSTPGPAPARNGCASICRTAAWRRARPTPCLSGPAPAGTTCVFWIRTTTANPSPAKRARYWLPVDLYVGGGEHSVLHLLYARFWHKVLYDCGLVDTPEPFQRLFTQGMMHADSYQSEGKYYPTRRRRRAPGDTISSARSRSKRSSRRCRSRSSTWSIPTT